MTLTVISDFSNHDPLFSCDPCTYQKECGWCFDKDDDKGSGSCVMHPGEETGWAEYGRCYHNSTEHGDPKHPVFNSSSAVWYYGYCPTSLSWLPILGMVLYLCCFSAGKCFLSYTMFIFFAQGPSHVTTVPSICNIYSTVQLQ